MMVAKDCPSFQLLLCLVANSAAGLIQPAPAAERPNIIYILADDLGYAELGCYGQEKIPTPHIDRLAVAGIRSTHRYSGNAVLGLGDTSGQDDRKRLG